VAGAALGDLQIEGHTFAIDQYGSIVQKLLAGAIVFSPAIALEQARRWQRLN